MNVNDVPLNRLVELACSIDGKQHEPLELITREVHVLQRFGPYFVAHVLSINSSPILKHWIRGIGPTPYEAVLRAHVTNHLGVEIV